MAWSQHKSPHKALALMWWHALISAHLALPTMPYAYKLLSSHSCCSLPLRDVWWDQSISHSLLGLYHGHGYTLHCSVWCRMHGVLPCTPCCPVSPVGPSLPLSPVDPGRPAPPARPVSPVGPREPLSPLGPSTPVRPKSKLNRKQMLEFYCYAPSKHKLFV